MIRKTIFWAGILSAMTLTAAAQPLVIAHRGFWKSEGAAQNSIAALTAAANAQVYGAEFDVQLTQDNELVVNHDDSIQGRCIADTPLAKLRQLRLPNGEPLPTLDEYLEAGKKCPQLRLVLEIKRQRTEEADEKVVRAVLDKVRQRGMEKQMEYTSMSLHVCGLMARLAPGSPIAYGYLKNGPSAKELHTNGVNIVNLYMGALDERPEWISEAHQLGMSVHVWTVDDRQTMRRMVERGVDALITNNPLLAQEVVRSH